MNIILWLIVVAGYTLAIYEIVKVLVFSYSLFSDVPYVPSSYKIAKEAIELLNLKKGDRFIDIGSGDGKAVFIAYSMYKDVPDTTFSGLEIRKFLTIISNIKKLFVNKNRIKFINSSAFDYNFSSFNKVFLYMTTDITEKLLYKLKNELPKGAQVVSCVFSPRDFLKDNEVTKKEVKRGKKRYNLYLWTQV